MKEFPAKDSLLVLHSVEIKNVKKNGTLFLSLPRSPLKLMLWDRGKLRPFRRLNWKLRNNFGSPQWCFQASKILVSPWVRCIAGLMTSVHDAGSKSCDIFRLGISGIEPILYILRAMQACHWVLAVANMLKQTLSLGNSADGIYWILLLLINLSYEHQLTSRRSLCLWNPGTMSRCPFSSVITQTSWYKGF